MATRSYCLWPVIRFLLYLEVVINFVWKHTTSTRCCFKVTNWKRCITRSGFSDKKKLWYFFPYLYNINPSGYSICVFKVKYQTVKAYFPQQPVETCITFLQVDLFLPKHGHAGWSHARSSTWRVLYLPPPRLVRPASVDITAQPDPEGRTTPSVFCENLSASFFSCYSLKGSG